ncbi:hypothetical protein AB0M28_03440 [Streptomyces sp. NPDC051940]|uniref:hypothetical protein n=1 Tax=Streptomyces sp. NPDC051940 TaxID=3155675 RepID=UPI003444BCD3
MACVAAGAVVWARSSDGGPDGGGRDRRVDARLVHFEIVTDLRAEVQTVLRSPADATAFAGWAPRRDLGRELAGVDFGREALVAFVWGTACARGRSADLTHAPGTGYSTRLRDSTSTMNCEAPYTTVAVFAVPRSRVPLDVYVGGRPPGPPGPAEQAAFETLPRPVRPRAAEVTQPDQLRAFRDAVPGAGLDDGSGARSGDRRFAFVLTGCRATGAVLRITEERMSAEPVGGEGARCAAAEYYVAVFRIAAERVPPAATIG